MAPTPWERKHSVGGFYCSLAADTLGGRKTVVEGTDRTSGRRLTRTLFHAARDGSSRRSYVLLQTLCFTARSPSFVSRSPRNCAAWPKLVQFYNVGSKIFGPSPKRNSGGQKRAKFGRSRATSNFDGEYIRNGWSYSKSETKHIDSDFSGVWRKKLGKLWSTNNKVLCVHFDPTNTTLSEEHISALRGCCPCKRLQVLEHGRGFLNHTHWSGVP